MVCTSPLSAEKKRADHPVVCDDIVYYGTEPSVLFSTHTDYPVYSDTLYKSAIKVGKHTHSHHSQFITLQAYRMSHVSIHN